jgi:hypothetical protein
LGYRINIFLARICFRGIYFRQMGAVAWAKLVYQNRRTIFTLAREGYATWRTRSAPSRPAATALDRETTMDAPPS